MARKLIVLALVAGVLPAVALAGASSRLPGSWHMLAPSPLALPYGSHVWTGKSLVVFGRRPLTRETFNPSVNAAVAYDPAKKTWRTLSPPARAGVDLSCCNAVWTGGRMLVFGENLAYNPRSNTWQAIHASLPDGIVVWTGREAIGWGGGCCGDAVSTGAAYNVAKDGTRPLPRSPLAPSQNPVGAWDGHELLLFVSGYDPEGKPYPARFARGAAYNPSTNTWRRIAALPTSGTRFAGTAAWTGRELIVAAAGAQGRGTLAYDPEANRWRRLAALPSSRLGASEVFWTGDRLVLWGAAPNGLVYDPQTNHWSSLARPPLRAAASTSAVWTGSSLIAFGGIIGSSAATGNQQVWLRGAAAFTPAARPW